MRWAVHVANMGRMRNSHKILVNEPEGKKTLGRRRSRWEDNIKMNLKHCVRVWDGFKWFRIV
jgi:hypothetical protein